MPLAVPVEAAGQAGGSEFPGDWRRASGTLSGCRRFTRIGSRPWVRAAGVVYPALVLVVIVATGNHFVLDAALGAAVAGAAAAATAAIAPAGRPARKPATPRMRARTVDDKLRT